jgi:hypothetical protein
LRFLVLTANLYWRLVCPDLSKKSAEKQIRALRQQGIIAAHPLVGNEVCYMLTPKGRQRHGLPRLRKPMGPHAIMRALTVAAFVASTGVRILSKEEAEKQFARVFFDAEKWPHGIPSAYHYTESADAIRCLLIDYDRHVRRILKFIEKWMRRLESYSVMRSLLKGGNYQIVILVGHESKAQAIRRLRLPYPVQVTVVPELGEMLHAV